MQCSSLAFFVCLCASVYIAPGVRSILYAALQCYAAREMGQMWVISSTTYNALFAGTLWHTAHDNGVHCANTHVNTRGAQMECLSTRGMQMFVCTARSSTCTHICAVACRINVNAHADVASQCSPSSHVPYIQVLRGTCGK